MDTLNEKQDLLLPWMEMTRFWSELDPPSRDDILNDAALLEFEQGDEIDIEFGLIISGTAGQEYTLKDGRRSITELFHTGDLVHTARHQRLPQGKLTALGYCGILSLRLDDFETCARHHSDVLTAYRRQVEDQTGRLRDHINDLAVKTPLERIVSVLFELRRWPDRNAADATEIALPILRKDIAAYLGIRPETLSRVLRKPLKQGLISGASSGHAIRLEDVPTLRLVAKGEMPDPTQGRN